MAFFDNVVDRNRRKLEFGMKTVNSFSDLYLVLLLSRQIFGGLWLGE